MKKMTKEEDSIIRNRLDEMGARLYHDVTLYDDAFWSYKMVKKLLLDVYLLQDELEKRTVNGKGKT